MSGPSVGHFNLTCAESESDIGIGREQQRRLCSKPSIELCLEVLLGVRELHNCRRRRFLPIKVPAPEGRSWEPAGNGGPRLGAQWVRVNFALCWAATAPCLAITRIS